MFLKNPTVGGAPGGHLGHAKLVVAGLTLAGAVMFWSASANATTYTYDFTPLTNADVGPSKTYVSNGVTITAAGFSSSTFATTVDLFSKNGSGDENGLGLVNDPIHDNEISGTSLIRIALPANYNNFGFQFGSSTSGEGWLVYGSNSLTTGYVLVASGTDENAHTLTGCTAGLNDGCYQNYYFAYDPAKVTASNTNVLLADVSFVSPVPLPGALPLFASGLGMLGYLATRRKRKSSQP